MMNGLTLKQQYLEENYETLTSLDKKEEHTVFLVKNRNDGMIYVKKYISPEAAEGYEKLKKLRNRNIVQVYEAAGNEERGTVIEEFINGMTLEECLQEGGLFKEARVCWIIAEICNGLFEVHNQRIVHRDIKPENIMITGDSVVKVIDFGIARAAKAGRNRDTEILGTAGYAAPEQFGYMQTDARADIYALGVLMNKLLTGALPVEHLYEAHPMNAVIRRCIEIDAKNRFQTIQELKRAVEMLSREVVTPQNQITVYEYKKVKSESSGCVIKGVPGFRTGVLWKNVVATMGYLFLIFCTIVWMSKYTSSVEVFLLGGLSVFLYAWASNLLAFNVGYWDRKLYPVRLLPKQVMLVVRIGLWFLLFALGMGLEYYIEYEFL